MNTAISFKRRVSMTFFKLIDIYISHNNCLGHMLIT